VIIILRYQFSIGHRAIFDVSGEKKNENAFALIITKTIIVLRLSEYCGIIPSTLFHNIHFAFAE